MYSRIVDVTLKTDKVNEVRDTIANELLPLIKKQPGFVDIIESLDAETGHFICQTFWKDKESLERYANNVASTFEPRLETFVTAPPRNYVMRVETSSIHRIAKGKAA